VAPRADDPMIPIMGPEGALAPRTAARPRAAET
jgi:hypothetical protein